MLMGSAMLLLVALGWWLRAPTPMFQIHRDISFAHVEGQPLMLDLYLPTDREVRPPVIIWLHGGSWKWGNKEHNPLRWTAMEGYASVTVNYRLSSQATFPAAIHDCKAVVRWLRANADEYGFDARRIVVAGGSAGGHLALLLAMTSDNAALEGSVGKHLEQSSKVQGVIDFFGPADLSVYQDRAGKDLTPAVTSFLGSPPWIDPTNANLASPIAHLDAGDPPLLIFHGSDDTVVQIAQSERLHKASLEAGIESTFINVEGAGHDGPEFYDEVRRPMIRLFLQKHLKN